MTTGVTLEKTESKFSCYVYYDEWTGSIMNISNTELEDSEYPSFYSKNPILKSIISGIVIARMISRTIMSQWLRIFCQIFSIKIFTSSFS